MLPEGLIAKRALSPDAPAEIRRSRQAHQLALCLLYTSSANNGAFNSTTGITINPAGANGTTLNYNSGTGGVAFANGAGGIKAAIDSNGTLWLGGAANSAGIAQIAHAPAITVSGIAATNLGIADSSSIWTFALDNRGNLGIAGGIYTCLLYTSPPLLQTC